jgi:hypothetical protein
VFRFYARTGAFVLLLLAQTVAVEAQISTAVQNNEPLLGSGSELRKFRAAAVSDAAGERLVFRATVRDSSGSVRGIARADASGNGLMIAQKNGSSPVSSPYRNFLQPAINSLGDVAWFAFLGDGGTGIFRTLLGDSSLHVAVITEASFAPIGVYRFTDFDAPEINDSGAVVFWARAADTISSNFAEGIFVCQGGDGGCVTGSGTASVLARDGDVVDGRELCEFSRLLHASVYGATFLATTRPDCKSSSDNREGVFSVDFAGVTGLRQIALAGALTDIGDGDTYQRFRDVPSIENDGIVAFRADTSTSEAVFRCVPAAGCPGASLPTSIVEKGQLHDGSELRRFGRPQVSDNGAVVFQARPRGGTATGRTLYRWRSTGAIERIVTGNQALDDVAGATFGRVGAHHVSPGGTVAFRSTVNGPLWRAALFLWQP